MLNNHCHGVTAQLQLVNIIIIIIINAQTTSGGEPTRDLTLFALRESWPEISMQLEGPETCHLDMPSWFSLVFKKTLKLFRI
jgi:hypothetical protein